MAAILRQAPRRGHSGILRGVGYAIEDGRLLTWALEAHLVDHCNLRCVHCCTLSPQLVPRHIEPEALERDLRLLARVLRPAVFKLTGGEPLLHPRLLECLQAARASGISRQLSLTTNGFFLAQAPDALFEGLDRLTLSWYTSAPLPEALVERIQARCAEHGVALTVKHVARFARMDAEAPFHDVAAARRVHAVCWLRVRCHMVADGRFYACTRPPHLEQRLRALGHETTLGLDDGVPVGQEPGALLARLLAYLESGEPLGSCRYCLGASGGFEEHAQGPS